MEESNRQSLVSQILAATDGAVEPLQVEEWGCTVYLRHMSGGERTALEETTKRKSSEWRAWIVAFGVAGDADGGRLFADDQVPALNEKSAVVLDRLVDAILDYNGLSSKDDDDAGK